MNNNNLTEEITILKTWKGETFEIDVKYEDFLAMESKVKADGGDGFNSLKYRRFIKFSAIEDRIGKTKYLTLSDPTEQKNKREAEKIQKKVGKIYNNFTDQQKIELNNLAKKSLLKRSNIFNNLIDNPLIGILIEHEKTKLIREKYNI